MLHLLPRLSHTGVQFKSYSEQYLGSTGMFKKATISSLATIAKQERVRLGERTKAGLSKAVAKGKQLSRPGVDTEKQAHVLRLEATGISNRAMATALDISPITVGKLLVK